MKVICGSGIYEDVVTISMLAKVYPGVPIYTKEEYLNQVDPPDNILIYSRESLEDTKVWIPFSAKIIPVEQLVTEALK